MSQVAAGLVTLPGDTGTDVVGCPLTGGTIVMKRGRPEGVFLLTPDNRSYVQGTRPWYYVGTGPATAGCSLILLFVVPLMGAAVLWHLIAAKLALRSFRQN